MIYAICVGRARDNNNNIIKYRLRDFVGNEVILDADFLKNEMSNGKIFVPNLTLTKDNKLVEKQLETLKDIKDSKGKVQYLGQKAIPVNVISKSTEEPSNNLQIDPNNSIIIGSVACHIDRENNLCITDMPSKTSDILKKGVNSACFIPKENRLFIFYAQIKGEDTAFRYMIYDMKMNTIVRDKAICNDTHIGFIGKKCCPKGEVPYYRDKAINFIFIPIYGKQNGSIEMIGMLAYSIEYGEHFYKFRRGFSSARSFNHLMEALKYSGDSVIPLACIRNDDDSFELRSSGKLIALNKRLQSIDACML